MKKVILDATCGSRMIWFQKYQENTVYMDCREEDGTAIWKSTKNDSVRRLNVNPDIIADFTNMPFPDDSFHLVVFDPPHLIRIGENAWMKKKYGKLPENWQKLIHDGFNECMRVLKPYGTLIFKWSEVQIPTRKVIDAIGQEPLFGNRSGKALKTHWMVFMKLNAQPNTSNTLQSVECVDTISRQAALDAIAKIARDNLSIADSYAYFLDALLKTDEGIKKLPSAQPKQGRWMHDEATIDIRYYVCSVCKRATQIPRYTGGFLYDYCPNCGARMVSTEGSEQ